MYTLSQIRRRVDALKRKYAAELTAIKLYPLAEDFCLLWTCAVADGNPVPDTHAFIRTIARNGVRLDTFTLLVPYLERCRNEEREPNSLSIISILLPQVPYQRIREMLESMAPILDERAARPRPSVSPCAPVRRPLPPVGPLHFRTALTWLVARWYAYWCAQLFPQDDPAVLQVNPGTPVRRAKPEPPNQTPSPLMAVESASGVPMEGKVRMAVMASSHRNQGRLQCR